jgi:phage portal protein BeeE
MNAITAITSIRFLTLPFREKIARKKIMENKTVFTCLRILSGNNGTRKIKVNVKISRKILLRVIPEFVVLV